MPNRIDRFRAKILKLGLDSYWVVSHVNVRYLTGFTGHESTLLVTRDRSFLVTDFRYQEQAEDETEVDEIVCRTRGMGPEVGGLCHKLGLPSMGVTAANLTHADWVSVTSRAPEVDVKSLKQGPVEKMRITKTDAEVEKIRRAVNVCEAAFKECVKHVEPGKTENWIAGRLEYEMRARGAERAAFETICAVDERGSLPHAAAGEQTARKGSMVLVDWGACVEGYHSDLTRVICTDKMPDKLREPAETVVDAQQEALACLGAGTPCNEVDRAARYVITRAGYGKYFGHGLGHGVGLEIHEAPRLSARDDTILRAGMVLTVEPGIYLPGVGGIRVEDTALVTTDGCEVLSSLSKIINFP
mgnify:CR=1 FL=1